MLKVDKSTDINFDSCQFSLDSTFKLNDHHLRHGMTIRPTANLPYHIRTFVFAQSVPLMFFRIYQNFTPFHFLSRTEDIEVHRDLKHNFYAIQVIHNLKDPC
jgi:hypothetical protein